ncbi:MAG TPA: DinB family protein [Armatimonadota bacterium]|jgi:uncharacterized damage-inducible protein DinB
MIEELRPVYQQLEETYDALRAVLEEIPDDRLDWRPAKGMLSASELTQHIARANRTYGRVIFAEPKGDRPPWVQGLGRSELLERVEASLTLAREDFEAITPERLHAPCADHWGPFVIPVQGPLDTLWFAINMVRHTAYHVGQLNTYSLLLEGGAEPG